MKAVSRLALPAAALAAAFAVPAAAQRPPSPEQQQILQLQQQLAASQASNISLSQRLDAVERQLQQIVSLEEQSGHRVSVLESNITQLRTDEDSRMSALEQKVAGLAAAPAPAPETSDSSTDAAPPKEAPDTKRTRTASAASDKSARPIKTASAKSDNSAKPADDSSDQADNAGDTSDPAEAAYSDGYHLWAAGNYDQAISKLTSFVSAYPTSARASWARNLIGRALLDEGQPRAAAEALLANYRKNPAGGRAQDSLYYLGQALMKLGQPTQACKAYSELDTVYGDKVRAELKPLVAKGKADANCQ